MRRQELHNLSSMSWLFLGNFIIMFLFPPEIVTLSLLILAIGDPVCNIIGIKYGKDKLIGSKSLQGSLAGFIACSIVSAAYFKVMDIMTSKLLLASVLSGFIGALAEVIPIDIDDNFVIPVVTAILLWGLFTFI